MKTIKEEINDIKKRNKILKSFEDLAEKEQYIKVESDLFEDLFDFANTNKRFDIKNLVKVESRQGELFLIRPDVTSNIIKQVIPRISPEDELKLYYLDTIYNFNSNGKINKTRQFGVEMIGGKTTSKEVSLLSLLNQLLTQYNLKYYIEVGNQLFVDLLLNGISKDENQQVSIKKALMTKNTTVLNNMNIKQNAYFTLLLKTLNPTTSIESLVSFIQDNNLNKDLLAEVQRVQEINQVLQQDNLTIDLSLVSPYDYYNGFIFKGYIENYNKDLFRGGRYDTLTKEYGELTKALGFSIDMDVFVSEVIYND